MEGWRHWCLSAWSCSCLRHPSNLLVESGATTINSYLPGTGYLAQWVRTIGVLVSILLYFEWVRRKDPRLINYRSERSKRSMILITTWLYKAGMRLKNPMITAISSGNSSIFWVADNRLSYLLLNNDLESIPCDISLSRCSLRHSIPFTPWSRMLLSFFLWPKTLHSPTKLNSSTPFHT
jgi:hypothetical protein